MLRPALAALLLVLAAACTQEKPSRLQQRDAAQGAGAPEPAAAAATAGDPKAAPAPTPAPGELVTEPPAGTELVELRLALREGTTYRVTTVGNLEFGAVVQPTGFAREERLSLSQCAGEGFARACTLEHRYVHFDAEPPNGVFLQKDEELVKQLVTSHALRATGERPGPMAIVGGPKEQAESPAGQALVDAHRFYCLRFPEQAIGVGARWRSSCRMRTGGVIDTRDVIWEFSKLERDPDTGLRAELKYLGKYFAPGKKGMREGTISGIVYFFVEAGEPHLIREQFTTASDSASAFVARTQVAYQFARLVPGPDGKESAVRVDGKPFPEAPAGAPATAPAPDGG